MKPESMGTLQSGQAGERCGTVPPLRRHLTGDLTNSMHGTERPTGTGLNYHSDFRGMWVSDRKAA